MTNPTYNPMALAVVVLAVAFAAGCEREASQTSEAAEPAAEAMTEPQRATSTTRGERPEGGGIGSRVFVVQRASETLSIYDFHRREMLDRKITGLGNLKHATMTFSPDLRFGYLATRNGKLSRIDLRTLEADGEIFTSENSIDIAITPDGRHIATAEYDPGGVTIIDAETLKVARRIPATYSHEGEEKRSKATGIVDASGNRIVFSLMEGGEAWVVDAGKPDFPVLHKIPLEEGIAYDAMITPDGRYYVVGHLNRDYVSLIDLDRPETGATTVSLRDPDRNYDPNTPVKLPHMASWAVAKGRVFVPLVGQSRLAVLDRETWEFTGSVPLRGHPVYAVRSPSEAEIWVSFSGDEDDAFVQIVDTETLETVKTIRVGRRIYHMDFTPRGAYVLVSANEDEKIALINARTYEIVDEEAIASPSGIFGVWRAFEIGL